MDTYYGGYFDWLCNLINLKPGRYDALIRILHEIEFDWVIELDSDRNYDGIVLRTEYDGNGYLSVDPSRVNEDYHCSILECLIGLARRMDFILDDEDRGDRTRIWFWEMIDNLGLDKYTDRVFIKDLRLSSPFDLQNFEINLYVGKASEIRAICEKWIYRKFSYAGKGSPFPLENPYENQRYLTMMDQMNRYIFEKHMFGDEIL